MSFFLIESEQYPYVYFGGGGKDTYFKIVGDNGVLNPSATFTRASQGTTEINQGVFTQAAVNEPRYQWSGGKRGLLIEPSATNIFLWSNDLTKSVWEAIGATVNSQSKITTTSASGLIKQTVSVTPGATYTFSFGVERGSMTDMKYSVYNITAATDIINPTSYYSKTSPSGESVISVTFTAPAGCVSVGVYPVRDSGVTGTLFINWLQIETGNKATSRIITTSSAATRAEDLITILKENISFNSLEGAFVCEYIADSNTTSKVVTSDASGSEFITRRQTGSHGAWNGISECNTTNQVVGVSKIKVGTTYWNAGIGVAMNGLGYNSINSIYSLSSATIIKIGPVSTPSLIFDLPYYSRKFTQAELQAATT